MTASDKIQRAFMDGARRGLGFSQGYPMGTLACLEKEAARYATALAAAAEGGDVQQAPGEAPQSGGHKPVTLKAGR